MYQKTEAVPDEVNVCMCVCTRVLPLIMQKGPNPLIMCFSPYCTGNKSWSVTALPESQSYYQWCNFCIRTDNTQWIIPFFLYVLYIYSCLLQGKKKISFARSWSELFLSLAPLSFTDDETLFNPAQCEHTMSYTAHGFKLSLLKVEKDLPQNSAGTAGDFSLVHAHIKKF